MATREGPRRVTRASRTQSMCRRRSSNQRPLPFPLSRARVGQQNRKKPQIGQYDGGYAKRCRDGNLLNHRNLDQRDGDEPRRIRSEGHDAGQEDSPETGKGRIEGRGPAKRLRLRCADQLDPMAYADGKDQERHEDRHRIDAVTERDDGTELPHHGCQGTADRHQREAEGARVHEEEDGREENGQGEERHDARGTGSDFPDQLRKSDDMYVYRTP